jgi:predicted GNAT family N-acyltransferase
VPRADIDHAKSPADLADALALRREVFCVEQGVAERDEVDGLDDDCRHYLVRLDGRPIATARVRRLPDGAHKVERVAVRKPWRGGGLGRSLMDRVVADIAAAGGRRVVLNAQLAVRGFYAGLGFRADGEVFEEAGIPHVRMTRELPPPASGGVRDS